MTELKTKTTNKNINEFLNNFENQRRREDSFKILKEVMIESVKYVRKKF